MTSIQGEWWNNLSVSDRIYVLGKIFRSKQAMVNHATKKYRDLPISARRYIYNSFKVAQ